MACDDCKRRDRRTSPDRLDERLKRLETKSHPGDVLALAVFLFLACWGAVKLLDKTGVVPIDG